MQSCFTASVALQFSACWINELRHLSFRNPSEQRSERRHPSNRTRRQCRIAGTRIRFYRSMQLRGIASCSAERLYRILQCVHVPETQCQRSGSQTVVLKGDRRHAPTHTVCLARISCKVLERVGADVTERLSSIGPGKPALVSRERVALLVEA
jgi:hypothetical protein